MSEALTGIVFFGAVVIAYLIADLVFGEDGDDE